MLKQIILGLCFFGLQYILFVENTRGMQVTNLLELLMHGDSAVISYVSSREVEEQFLVTTDDYDKRMVGKSETLLLDHVFNIAKGQYQLEESISQLIFLVGKRS